MAESYFMTIAGMLGVLALYLFLPLSALTFSRQRRTTEVVRALEILKINRSYWKMYVEEQVGYYLLCAVVYASVVSCLGLLLLFLGPSIGLAEFPAIPFGGMAFPREGSRLVFGMAFLGAYLWGLQYIFRRYSLNDLTPSVYYTLSMRMMFAAVIALVIYNVFEALTGGGVTLTGTSGIPPDISETPANAALIGASLWPILAFLLGMFPQRGLRWLSERLPIFSPGTNAAPRNAPLELIEGIEIHDTLRLEEVGIDTCYDLATADFIPLVLKTPYSARQLIDWILQAKLCVYFGETVNDLRQYGIRTILDLECLSPDDILALSTETSATKSALERARNSIVGDKDIGRLRSAGEVLGHFWPDGEQPPGPIERATALHTSPYDG